MPGTFDALLAIGLGLALLAVSSAALAGCFIAGNVLDYR